MAVISGPGGLAVSAAEACSRAGLAMAELAADTRTALANLMPPTGTSTANPIDVGLTASLDVNIYIESARSTAMDPGVDAVVVIGIGLDRETNERYTQGIMDVHQSTRKPFIMVGIPGFGEEIISRFCNAGIPFFDSAERAMQTYAQVCRYQEWRRKIGGKGIPENGFRGATA